MKCQVCGINEANLHFTKIIDNKLEEKHICEECAAKDSDFDFSSPFTGTFSVQKLFSGLFDDFAPVQQEFKDKDLVCESCDTSYREFRKTGKFGCSHCYESFEDKLVSIFKGIHGAEVHTGKIPESGSEELKLEKDIGELRSKLSLAVEEERYEDAAVIRDKIKALEDKVEEIKSVKEDEIDD